MRIEKCIQTYWLTDAGRVELIEHNGYSNQLTDHLPRFAQNILAGLHAHYAHPLDVYHVYEVQLDGHTIAWAVNADEERPNPASLTGRLTWFPILFVWLINDNLGWTQVPWNRDQMVGSHGSIVEATMARYEQHAGGRA